MYRIGIIICSDVVAYLENLPDFTEDDDYLTGISLCGENQCHIFESEDEAYDVARNLGVIFSNGVVIDRQTEWEREIRF